MKQIQLFPLLPILRAAFFGFFFVSYSQCVLADKVDDFIQSIQVATYDCPDDQFMPQVDQYLNARSVLPEQLIELKVHKAHWLICVGKNDEAQIILENLLADPVMDKSSQSYANVNYQLGFIFDIQEKPEKCDFYRKSEQLAKDKFSDVYLSSQLGLITVCGQNGDNVGVKLGRLFALLKLYSLQDDQKALAHIHNNVGILYSSIGQRSLAAEQYEKSYQIGLKVYEEKNQLNTLISLITAHSGSGDYEKAKLMIDELGKRNLKVNTPLSNSLFHFAESRQAYRTNDYESFRNSMRSWDVFLKQTSSQTMEMLYEWYAAALCLNDEDRVCVNEFLQKQNDTRSAMPASLSKHLYYIAFLVKANLFLGNVEAAQLSFDNYFSISLDKLKKQQASARILGVANLHNEIIGLESSLAESEEQRLQIILLVLISILGLIALGYLFWGRAYFRKLATDPLTGLSNEHSVLAKIKKVKAPIGDKVNALALFDVSNFTSVNAEYGYKAGELALKQVADCLKQVTREKDIVGRVAADQFIVCLVNIEDMVAKELFSRVQKALADVRFKVDSRKKVDVHSHMHVYRSVNSLSDVDDVLAEIRSVLRKA
ncbi:GGDEF domain-containing protein [Paraglaciecola sp. MB-3u-78]|jgi:diguanylate cyclase (GGDEF)-like protein|uniref:GGDEF domain-containing protein n=1 Tax=Paraglaciecola sp. MB-3u-78 TaxID=2058332 RepID=UPI000C327AE2|nr:GGDEF domain-containing protein [Paraglaciecola sp. MB-3u-78]PKG99044.1 GGDEF domain-containing protein [Paraglaciecola sp. MB-3u-78]